MSYKPTFFNNFAAKFYTTYQKVKMKFVFIVNPISGTKGKQHIVKLLPDYFEEGSYAIRYTERAGHAEELAREAAQAEKEVVPEEEIDKGKAALTELFNGVKNINTPIIVERIVTDIDDIVKIVRFDGWQNTTGGKQEVKKALRSVVWVKYKIKDKEAVHHKYYKYYAPKHYIDTILREEAVFLSDGENWNDVRDKERLNDDNRYKRFALCLSYSRSENVAMWMLYAGNDGCMIDYPQKVITAILNSDCVYAGAFSRETGTFETQLSIGLDGFQIDAYDVVYFAEAKKEPNTFYYVKRSDESSSEFRRDIIEKLSYQKKTLPWSYENECRIVVSVNKQKYKEIAQIHSLKITMPKGIQKERGIS